MKQIMSAEDNKMIRKSKKLLFFCGVAMSAVLFYTQLPMDEVKGFCDCSNNMVYAHALPMSHPINRCASAQANEVSWVSWVSGGSHSYQFHFLDLLELLSRHAEVNNTNG